MRNIQVLDENTINKIAAGEVVERPGSVVKELIENAVDAGADTISIEIKEGGSSLIKISDNGCGIPKNEIKTAFLRHATSKITSIEDLEKIYSLGFRGEALASISAVSQVEMASFNLADEIGTAIEIHGGKFISEKDFASSEGTSVAVKNLFYNVPARRKFLKRASVESGYISDIVNKAALGHPEISFKYTNNDSIILHTAGNNDLKTAVFSIYGKETAQNVLPVKYKKNSIEIEGFIGKPVLSRANRNYETIFINGRYVKNIIISSAIEAAFKTRIPIGKFPFFVLNLSIPAPEIDINVHPSKLQVKFHDEEEIYKCFLSAANETLKSEILIPEVNLDSKNSEPVKKLIAEEYTQQKIDTNFTSNNIKKGALNYIDEIKESSLEKTSDTDKLLSGKDFLKPLEIRQTKKDYKIKTDNKEPFFVNYRIVGQIFDTYWIAEQNESIFLVDQHAAHERIMYERLIVSLKKEGHVPAQQLLVPEEIKLSEEEKQSVIDNIEDFIKYGFDIKDNNGIFVLYSVPYILRGNDGVHIFNEMLDALAGKIDKTTIYDVKASVIASIACKSAIKGNTKYAAKEAENIIKELMALENPFSCPHGRPTIIEITKYELEKKFKRIQ